MKRLGVFFAILFFLVACDDDESFMTRPSDDSELSSSGKKDGSSSSGKGKSSSAEKDASSSSKKAGSSSSSSDGKSTEKSSSSLESCEELVARLLPECVKYGTMTDERDGHVYKTLYVGDYMWMAENLDYDYKVEGDSSEGSCSTRCCEMLGRSYQWKDAVDSAGVFSGDAAGCGYKATSKQCTMTLPVQGICPEGWHLPSSSEWNSLFGYVSSSRLGLEGNYWTSYDASGEEATAVSVRDTSRKLERDDKYHYKFIRCVKNDFDATTWNWLVSKEERFNPDIEYGELKDERDNQVYRTVTVGEQTWMAENLNYIDTNNVSYCYNWNPRSCSVAGRLYRTFNRDSTCPAGWRIPSESDWRTLFNSVGGENRASMALKTARGWNGIDEVGFSILPAGYQYYSSGYGSSGPVFAGSGEITQFLPNVVVRNSGLHFEYNPTANEGSYIRCIKVETKTED